MAVKAGCPASTKTTVNTQKYPSAPAMTIDTVQDLHGHRRDDAGTFDIALTPRRRPTTVNNFVFLANKGFYHCVIFHRVIPQFMDQTGDPTGTGTGGPGYTIQDETRPRRPTPPSSTRWVRWPWPTPGQPNTGGSQFFIVAGPQGETLPNTYALFGHVTSGMNVVDTINQQGSQPQGVPPDVTQRIISVTIHET